MARSDRRLFPKASRIISVPLAAITKLGMGDLDAGIGVIQEALATMDSPAAGDYHPLFTDYIFPLYGGPDGFDRSFPPDLPS